MTLFQQAHCMDMYEGGEKMSYISAVLDKNRVSIQRFLKRVGMPRRRPGRPSRRHSQPMEVE